MISDWVMAFSVTTTAAIFGAALLFGRDWLHQRRVRGLPGPAWDTVASWLMLSGLLFVINAAVLAPLSRNSVGLPCFMLLNAVVATTAAAFLVVLLTQRFWMVLALVVCALLAVDGHLFWAGVVLAALVLGVAWRPGTSERRRQLSYVLEELAEAQRQGLPLHEIMEALSQDQRGGFAGVLRSAAERLKTGAPLSVALDAPRVVPPHVLAAIRAGEAGGGRALPHVLRGTAADLRAEATARSALAAAITYPLAVWTVCLPVALFLVIFILPKFTDILRVLPPPRLSWWPLMTRVATAIVYASTVLLLLPVIHAMSPPVAATSPPVSPIWRGCDALACYIEGRLPLFRARLRQRSLARCARALGAMFESGMALPQACRQVAAPELAGSCAPAFARLAQATEEGRPLAEALRAARLPESFCALALAGAAGGAMASAMAAAAEWHEARARRLDRIMAVLLPCITIPATGLLVGCVYGGVFAAINAMRIAVIPAMLGVW